MQFTSIDVYVIIDTFLLLLIGVGPKIALVPFLELTADLDTATKARVIRKMITTASVTALLLVVFGGVLTRLLHFSPGALGIAGGLILLVLSARMVLGTQDDTQQRSMAQEDPMELAVSPLAVPYLLNPAGIVVLVTISAEAEAGSFGLLATVVGILVVVIAIDVVVFRFANRVSAHLDESRMLVTEKVFGFLLAALAVQLVLNGLSDVGVITLAGH